MRLVNSAILVSARNSVLTQHNEEATATSKNRWKYLGTRQLELRASDLRHRIRKRKKLQALTERKLIRNNRHSRQGFIAA